MKTGTILTAISKRAAIHVCLAVFFAFCWFVHCVAFRKMDVDTKRLSLLMDEKAMRAMALVDWVAAHWWLAIAYVVLVVASIAFLQIRGRPQWTCWIAAAVYCSPWVVYWLPCAYIMGAMIAPPTGR